MPLNTVFGILCAIVLARREFRGKALLNAAHRPAAQRLAGRGRLALIIVYGRRGWFGGWLAEHGMRVIFALPGMVLATMFVSLPFVAREVMPRAARDRHRAGAGGADARRLLAADLPAYHAARHPRRRRLRRRADRGAGLGEYGAVTIVSGHIAGRTETMTLYVEERFQSFDLTGAYAMSLVLALLSLATLLAMNAVRSHERKP